MYTKFVIFVHNGTSDDGELLHKFSFPVEDDTFLLNGGIDSFNDTCYELENAYDVSLIHTEDLGENYLLQLYPADGNISPMEVGCIVATTLRDSFCQGAEITQD